MSVRRSLAYMMASQIGLFVLQFGGSVALAHLLTPREMGIYAIAAALIGIIGLIQSFGVGLFVIREIRADHDVLASAFTMNALLSLLLAAIIVGLSVFGAAFLGEPGVRTVMLVLALTPLIGILEFRPATMLEREGDFKVIASLNVLRAISSTVVTVTLAVAGYSYMSIAWGAVAGSASGAIGCMIVGRRHNSVRLGFTAWRNILRFGLQQLAIQGVNALSARISEFMMGRMLGLEALGLWGRAGSLNNLLWANIHMVIGRVMMVDLAEHHRAGRSLREVYLRTVAILTAVLWPSFSGLAILAGPFISVVYGKVWIPAAAPLAGLAVSAIVLVSLTMTWEVFVARGETSRQARLEFVRTGVGLVLFIAGCLVNLFAASLARVGEALFSIVLYRPHVERMTETRWADYAGIYQRSAAITAAACGPAFILMTAYHWEPTTPISLVALAIAAGGCLWLVALKLLRHPLWEELSHFINKGLRAFRPA